MPLSIFLRASVTFSVTPAPYRHPRYDSGRHHPSSPNTGARSSQFFSCIPCLFVKHPFKQDAAQVALA